MKIKNNFLTIIRTITILLVMVLGIFRNLNNNLFFFCLFLVLAFLIGFVLLRRIFFPYLEIRNKKVIIYSDYWLNENYDVSSIKSIEEKNYNIILNFDNKKVKINSDRFSEKQKKDLLIYFRSTIEIK